MASALFMHCLLWLLSGRSLSRRDPTRIDIIDDRLHLYGPKGVYERVPISRISAVYEMAFPVSQASIRYRYGFLQGRNGVSEAAYLAGVRVAFDESIAGIDSIYISPYLKGYSDLISRLRPNGSAWAMRRERGLSWGVTVFVKYLRGALRFCEYAGVAALLGIVVYLVVSEQRNMNLHWTFGPTLPLLMAEILLIILMCLRGVTTGVTFDSSGMCVTNGLGRTRRVTADEIRSVSTMMAGFLPERCRIDLEHGSIRILSGFIEDYLGLVEQIKLFARDPGAATVEEPRC
jgi:hypothetical protein